MMDSEQILLLIKKYYGIPYKHAGRDRSGVDCLGLIHLFYRDCGIHVPDSDGREYSPIWTKTDPQRYLRGLLAVGGPAPLDDLKPLDLVYFRMGRNITHGGIMVDSQRFIHVLQTTRVHLSRLDSVWRRRLAGARRLV